MILASITPKKIGEIFRFHVNGAFAFYKVEREVKAPSSVCTKVHFYEVKSEEKK